MGVALADAGRAIRSAIPNRSHCRLEGDTLTGSTHSATCSGPKELWQLQRGRQARPDGFDGVLPASRPPRRLSRDDALRPSKANLMEIEIGMLWTHAVEDAGNCAPDP
jgi:hypothetical protein